ncbi:MAG: TetR family transcriptional regulator [Bacteroidetes bacterium]|jgi:AcrR family transcriptional regulator|nr:TetR family transcriptional regulator [Bacteroidota bacterium]
MPSTTSTKRDAICDAALELFAERGIDATSTRAIAERAGAAEGTLYRHFSSKDELVDYLFERGAERFRDHLVEHADPDTPPTERLRALVRGVFTFAETHAADFRYLLSMHHTGILQRRDGHYPPPMRPFIDALEAGIKAGTIRPLPPALATGWLIAMAQRAIVLLQSGMTPGSRAETIEQNTDAALRIVDARCQLHATS